MSAKEQPAEVAREPSIQCGRPLREDCSEKTSPRCSASGGAFACYGALGGNTGHTRECHDAIGAIRQSQNGSGRMKVCVLRESAITVACEFTRPQHGSLREL